MDQKGQEIHRAEVPAQDEEIELENSRKYIGINQGDINKAKFDPEDVKYLSSNAAWEDIGVEKDLANRLVQLGFKRPSFIQSKIITLAAKSNVVGQAQNGAGKTLAFLIPVIRTLEPISKLPDIPSPQVLILADTKALIMQTAKILFRICEGFKQTSIGMMFSGQTQIATDTNVLISTIAQVRFAAQKKTVDFSNTKLVVVDEADHVFDADFNRTFFQVFVHRLMNRPDFRVIFTSATMTDDFRAVIQMVQEKKNVLCIELPVEQLTLKNVKQYAIEYSNPQQKLETLQKLIEQVNAQNILIFDNRIRELESLHAFLVQRQFKAAFVYKSDDLVSTTSAINVQQMIDQFLAGKYRILLTTNLLSRGIDMRKVTLVINFSLPIRFVGEDRSNRSVDLETYLHRVGRTGRFGDHGVAVNFVNSQAELEMVQQIKDYYKSEIKQIGLSQLDNLNQELLSIQSLNEEKREYLEEVI